MKRRATVLCERGDHVLLVARQRGRWAFPGGRQKPGEELGDTARRELREETGLDAISVSYAFEFRGLRTRHFVFSALVGETAEAVPSNEIARCRWVHLDELLSLEASIPTKGIAAILLKQVRSVKRRSVLEAIDTTVA
jgi:8-oxo-dGTP diphosphatase